ncbi:hypothetical protein LTR62_007864 [Meristemomyces frigidus]|uniref:Arrestin C-terminal-like domain-containing protein n=1 Tax=Meristemomyces frigidus TaxID=1508187 RepID=A0AAN7TA79_9PEZI|nr:hypothetical protein LTR62_007864 [Meristemomyces frigidus]
MANGIRTYEISRPKPLPDTSEPRFTAPASVAPQKEDPSNIVQPAAWPPPLIRPLSDIREITEPSLMDMVSRFSNLPPRRKQQSALRVSPESRSKFSVEAGMVDQKPSLKQKRNVRRSLSGRSKESTRAEAEMRKNPHPIVASSSYSSTPDGSSCYAIPYSSVPRRSSSCGQSELRAKGHSRNTSLRAALATSPPPQLFVPNRGPCRSPVKETIQREDAVSTLTSSRVASRTQIRRPHPIDMLEAPDYKHPRLTLELRTAAPVFVGGGSIEGFVVVTVDQNDRSKDRRNLGIRSLTIDLLGCEHATGDRKAMFLALGTDVIDQNHPPPAGMIEHSPPLTLGEKFWTLDPSKSALPFMISLPLDTGPPPFQSRQATIRYLLCATAVIRDAGTQYRVRVSRDVPILPTYDPEKALAPLSKPLTVSDELPLPKTAGHERVKATAGLHRQTWLSGSTIFVDIHVANKSRKVIRKLHLSLERAVLCYKHTAAALENDSRLFESNHRSIVAESVLKSGTSEWSGVQPYSSETRTCSLAIPRDHASIRCGKYLEVRFFLNTTVSISSTKSVFLQLPVTLIHMNSIDVLPNSVSQVAAAIEEKRHEQRRHQRKRSNDSRVHGLPHHVRQRSASSPAKATLYEPQRPYRPGQAFAAPQRRSLEKQRAKKSDIESLRYAIDTSPRKHMPKLSQAFTVHQQGSNISFEPVKPATNQTSGIPYAGLTSPTPPRVRHRHNKPIFGTSTPTLSAQAAERVDSIRQRMRRMASFDTFASSSSRSKKPLVARYGAWQEKTRPPPAPRRNNNNDSSQTSVATKLAPYTLPLPPHLPPPSATHRHQPFSSFTSSGSAVAARQPPPPPSRPATATAIYPEPHPGFRERQERSRFEFKPVRRRGSESSSLRERGMSLWETVRRKGSRDTGAGTGGWI